MAAAANAVLRGLLLFVAWVVRVIYTLSVNSPLLLFWYYIYFYGKEQTSRWNYYLLDYFVDRFLS